jgi:hypothetical protein
MRLITLLNQCQHFSGFIYVKARLLASSQTMEIDVRPTAGRPPSIPAAISARRPTTTRACAASNSKKENRAADQRTILATSSSWVSTTRASTSRLTSLMWRQHDEFQHCRSGFGSLGTGQSHRKPIGEARSCTLRRALLDSAAMLQHPGARQFMVVMGYW